MLVIPVDQVEELLVASGGTEAKRAVEIFGHLSAMRGRVMMITARLVLLHVICSPAEQSSRRGPLSPSERSTSPPYGVPDDIWQHH
jgi:hypothetical protein